LDSDVPGLALSEPDRLFLTWYDVRNGANIYFANSTDGGVTFSQGQQVNSDLDSADDWSPGIAVGSGDTVSVCWTDGRRGGSTPDVYFARGVPIPGGIADEARRPSQSPPLLVSTAPNPARGLVRFALVASRAASVTLEVCDASGRVVRRFGSVEVGCGSSCTIDWNTERGRVPPGVYFVRWNAGSNSGIQVKGTGRFCIVR
jgi:hypothetical protein